MLNLIPLFLVLIFVRAINNSDDVGKQDKEPSSMTSSSSSAKLHSLEELLSSFLLFYYFKCYSSLSLKSILSFFFEKKLSNSKPFFFSI